MSQPLFFRPTLIILLTCICSFVATFSSVYLTLAPPPAESPKYSKSSKIRHESALRFPTIVRLPRDRSQRRRNSGPPPLAPIPPPHENRFRSILTKYHQKSSKYHQNDQNIIKITKIIKISSKKSSF